MHLNVDTGLLTYYKNFFRIPAADIFISSVSFAFRNRLRYSGLQQLTFPFACFRLKPGGILRPDSTWVQNFYNTHGRWLEDMNNPNAETGDTGDRVKVFPFYADYEAIFWSNEYIKALEIYQRIYKGNWDDNIFEYSYIINGEEYLWDGVLEYNNLELDPEFQEQEEITRAKLHSVSFDFQVKAFCFDGMAVEKANGFVLDMYENNGSEIVFPPPMDPDNTIEIP